MLKAEAAAEFQMKDDNRNLRNDSGHEGLGKQHRVVRLYSQGHRE